ncbi:RNA polymerase sigma factor [Anaerolentibacter hominis]|uniref:RNA polymerase sigma factor n=1 Tax=Anaerolentibacter hominis TaxID=3079009 RepID=UPI0031B8A961
MYDESLRTDDLRKRTIEAYSDLVYRLAYSLVKNRYDADDIYQEVFYRYIQKKPKFENIEHQKAWFIRVTVNCCKNLWKSAWKNKITEWTEEEGKETNPFDLPEQDRELLETVKQLPEKYRVVIHLFYYEDMSIEEISHILRKKPSTVRTQLTRARQILKEWLKEEL